MLLPIPIRGLLFLSLACGLSAAEAKRILFLSGSNSHNWGQHKHLAGSNLLCASINESPGIEAEVITEWPDAATLAKADALVRWWQGYNHKAPAAIPLVETLHWKKPCSQTL